MVARISQSKGGPGSLWQGDASEATERALRYDVIVFCAEEFQPPSTLFLRPEDADKVTFLYAPNDDSEKPLTRAQLNIATAAARQVARAYREGKRVLVSCMQGRNRSGLVSALSLHLLYGVSGNRAKSIIRALVPHALSNPSFERFLGKIPAKGTTVPHVATRMQAFRGGRDGRDD